MLTRSDAVYRARFRVVSAYPALSQDDLRAEGEEELADGWRITFAGGSDRYVVELVNGKGGMVSRTSRVPG